MKLSASLAFRDSLVLKQCSPALDQSQEMQCIRLTGSTLFGTTPPVISLADTLRNRDRDTFQPLTSST